jgi:hypothetical protein
MTVEPKGRTSIRHAHPDQRAGLDVLPPFASAAGDFELDDLRSAARALRRLPDEPCMMAALRAALADPPGIHALSRVEPRELAQWAAFDLLVGDLVALIAPSTSGASGAAKAKPRPVAREEFVPYQPAAAPRRATGWIAIELVDDEGAPYEDEFYRLELPDGSTRQGRLDGEGKARIENIPEGKCKVFFPDLDATESSGTASSSSTAPSPPAGSATAAAVGAGGAEPEAAGSDGASDGAGAQREGAATKEDAACFFEMALPVIPAIDEGEEYPPSSGMVTLRSSGGYERAVKVSEGTRAGDFCHFRFDDIPAERHDDDFAPTLTWDGVEITLWRKDRPLHGVTRRAWAARTGVRFGDGAARSDRGGSRARRRSG